MIYTVTVDGIEETFDAGKDTDGRWWVSALPGIVWSGHRFFVEAQQTAKIDIRNRRTLRSRGIGLK